MRSVWLETAAPPVLLPALAGDKRADVAIVGAGYAGLNAALRLAELGRHAIVLDAYEPGFGASGRNGGQVIAGLKYDPDELLAMFGEERGRRLVAFVGEAPARTFGLIEHYGMQCDALACGWLQPAVSEAAAKRIERRAAQWRARGVGVRLLDAMQTRALTGTGFYRAAWVDPRGGQLQPLSYARELARAALKAGAEIFARSPVTRLTREGDAWRVDAAGHSVRARAVLLCTNAYTGRLFPDLNRTIIPASSVIAATEPLTPQLRREIMPSQMPISDTRRLLSYLRFDAVGRFLIGARGSFGLHEPDRDFRHLRREAEAIFPQLAGVPWQAFWGGRFALTTDHLPHIVNPAEAVYSILGCNGRGVALLSQLGRVLGDLANGQPHEEVPLPMSAIAPIPFHRFRRAGLETVALWYRVLDRLEL
jgi:sarcosine oxidase